MDEERKKARFKFSVASSVNPARNEPVLLTDELIENVRLAAEIGYPALEIHVQNAKNTTSKSQGSRLGLHTQKKDFA